MLNRLLRKTRSGDSDSSSQSGLGLYSDSLLPPLAPLKLHGYKTLTKQHLMDAELADNIRNLIPARNQLYDEWEMVYLLEQHGISLRTLYRNCDPEYQREQLRRKQNGGHAKQRGYADSIVHAATQGSIHGYGNDFRRHQGYVLVIKDENNNKFGAYMSEHPHAVDGVYHYGNGECFLWKCERYLPREFAAGSTDEKNPGASDEQNSEFSDEKNSETTAALSRAIKSGTRFKAFMHTGLNRNTIYSNYDCMSFGSSGGRNGLWIDKSMESGISYVCDTYGNEVLNAPPPARFGKFKIMGLEIWRIGALDER